MFFFCVSRVYVNEERCQIHDKQGMRYKDLRLHFFSLSCLVRQSPMLHCLHDEVVFSTLLCLGHRSLSKMDGFSARLSVVANSVVI